MLYIDRTIGNPDQVFADLHTLCGGDGGLGTTNIVGNPELYQVTYTRSVSTPLAVRIKALVDSATHVIVSSVPSSWTSPTGSAITANAGLTFEDASGSPVVVRVVYDLGLCNGSGYWVDGQSGSRISFPRTIILYHELSHAWHYASGTLAATTAAEEQAAEEDENVARQQFGEPLRLVTSHNGGCGAPGGATGANWQIDCFVVTATKGTGARAAVDRLRLVRDAAVRTLPLGRQTFDDLYREYYSYSPALAARLSTDPVAKQAYLEAVVEPLLRTYDTALALLAAWPDLRAVDAALADALGSTLPPPGGAAARELVALLAGGPAGEQPSAALADAAALVAARDRLPLTEWAILRPLRAYWALAEAAAAGTLDPAATAPYLREAIVAWWAERVPFSLPATADLGERVAVLAAALSDGGATWQV